MRIGGRGANMAKMTDILNKSHFLQSNEMQINQLPYSQHILGEGLEPGFSSGYNN